MSLRPLTPLGLAVSTLLCACMSQSPKDSLESAKVRLAANDRRGAVLELKTALQANPDLAEARFLLGKTLLELDEITSAEVELNKAHEAKFDADRVLPLLAQARFELGKHQRVLEDFDAGSLGSREARAQLLAVQAQAHLALRNTDDAGRVNQQALQENPANLRARLTTASLAFNQRDVDSALQQLDLLLADDPNNVRALEFKGQALEFGRRDPEAAARVYAQVLKLEPRSVGAYTSLTIDALRRKDLPRVRDLLETMRKNLPGHPQVHYLSALLALAEGKVEAAREQVPLLLRSQTPPAAYLQLAGLVAYKLGAMTEAEKYFTRSLLEDGQNANTRLMLSQVHLHRGDAARALTVLEPMLSAKPPLAEALAGAGQAYIALGQLAKAQAAYELAVKLNPEDTRAKAQLAVTDIERGRVDAGLASLTQLSAQDSSHYADLALISAHMRRRQYELALQGVDRLLSKPNAPKVQGLVLRGSALVALSRRDEARKSFDSALQLERTHYVATAGLAMLDLADKRNGDAARRFERILSIDPGNLQAEMSLIGIKQSAGTPPGELVTALRDLVKRHPGVPQPRLALIEQLRQNGDTQGSLSVAQDAAAALPQSQQLLEALGVAQMVAKDFNQAAATFNRLVNLAPGSAQPHYRLAELHLSQDKTEAAVQALRRARSLEPDYMAAALLLAKTLAQGGRTAELRQLGLEVRKNSPNSALGHLFEGEAEAMSKNWAAAAKSYRAGLEMAPENIELAIKYARSLRSAGRVGETERFISEHIAQRPKDTSFIGAMADDLLSAGRREEALQFYLKVLDQLPGNAAAANNAAWLLHELKRPGALELAERAVKASASATNLDTLAAILADSNQMQRAIETQRRAVTEAPKAHVMRLRLAKLLLRQGDKDGARRELDSLAALGKNFNLQQEVRELQQKL
jgi:putative PEP-CTERM system TPR-repeat lipoprotein